MNKSKNNIRFKIVTPLVIMLFVSGVIFAFGGYRIQKKQLSAEIESKTLAVDRLFERLLAKESKFMTAQLQFIASDQMLVKAWQARDRSALYDRASSIFKEINNGFDVTHFYFIEPDKTCFLRVHSPDKFGDEINRLTLKEAAGSLTVSSGIELGVMGSFTLRVVWPWIANGKLLGYIELGEEIEHLTPRLKEISNLDLIFTIDKQNLVRKEWERADLETNMKGNWDEYPEFVVIDKTISSLPSELQVVLQQNHLHENLRTISLDNRLLSIHSHPLLDVSGRRVGTTTAIYDITNKSKETRKSIIFLAMVILSIFLLILLFYYRYSGMIAAQIDKYRNNLESLVEERTRELHIALDEVKVLSGFLPICASCKQIRDDKGYWTQIETYIRDNSEAEFSHGICPDCAEKLYPDIRLSKRSNLS